MNTEWIILADYAEFTSGKLYLMGGGWDSVTINHPARIHHFGIASAFRVLSEEADSPQEVAIGVIAFNRGEPLIELQAHLDLGVSGDPEGRLSQLAQLALNLSVEFEDEGLHYAYTSINGIEDHRFPFIVRFGKRLPT